MNDKQAIIRCALENPADSLPLNALADFLDDEGNHEGAESIRSNIGRARGIWMHSGIESLRGRKVVAARFDDDTLSIETDTGNLAYVVHGDCCSESWWHLFDGVKNLIGGTVVGFFEGDASDIDENDGRGRQESESIYSIGIVTDKGTSRIVFRNSSNGYYGGWIQQGEYSASGTPLTDDWISPIPTEGK